MPRPLKGNSYTERRGKKDIKWRKTLPTRDECAIKKTVGKQSLLRLKMKSGVKTEVSSVKL